MVSMRYVFFRLFKNGHVKNPTLMYKAGRSYRLTLINLKYRLKPEFSKKTVSSFSRADGESRFGRLVDGFLYGY